MFHDSALPRPEYPRPDRQRGWVEGIDWLNLNGPWQFRFDPHRLGHQQEWWNSEETAWREQIIVPFCWESLAAWGEGGTAGNDNFYSTRVYRNPVEVTPLNHRWAERYEVGWYRRTIRVPSGGAWHNKRVILTIGAADFFTDLWCNQIHLGRHEGGYVPFEFDLTDHLSPADETGHRQATIVIRVEDPMDHREQPVGKQWGWYTTTSGIWQTVFVEPRTAAFIDHFRIYPNIDTGSVSFEVVCANEGCDQCKVTAEIIPPESRAFTITLTVSGNVAFGDAEIHPMTLWDTVNPCLYRVVFRMWSDRHPVPDEVSGYFGMRKISTTPAGMTETDMPAMLCLNNKPIYLRGALYQSYYPEGVYTAADACTLKNDIIFALQAGFDFLRIHIKLDDPIFLYYADTLGILLMQDFPNFGEGGDTPTGRRRFEEMMREGFKRDFNHPSIISWCIFNETWGFGGQAELMKNITPHLTATQMRNEMEKISNSSSFKWVHEMWTIAKSIDPTRLIEDMSVVVWEHLAAYGHVDTDINSWHFYINDYHKAKEHIEEVVANSYHGSTYNYIDGYYQRNVPLINSEYGGVGALDGDRDVSWSFKFLTNELRRHGQLSAYIYTELMDVEWEYNGLMNYDRTPKQFGYSPSIINQGDVLPINAPPISQLEPGGTVEVEVLSSHFSRRRRDGVTFHWLYSGIDTIGALHPCLERGHADIPFRHHRVELARRLTLALPSEPMLCTLSVAAVNPRGEVIASNFIQHFVCGEAPPEREDRGQILLLRRRVQDWDLAEWSGGYEPREVAEQERICQGRGEGYFEWVFSDPSLKSLANARRVTLLLEASSARRGIQQTDTYRHPSRFEISVNGLPVLRTLLPDHPHDSRGVLSFMQGDTGAYGYLHRPTLENGLLSTVAKASAAEGILRIRTSVPGEPQGGLTIYEYDRGRYPVALTLIIEWNDPP